MDRFNLNDIVKVHYKENEYRLAQVKRVFLKESAGGILPKYPERRMLVQFIDNGEEREYMERSLRITLADPQEIVTWRLLNEK